MRLCLHPAPHSLHTSLTRPTLTRAPTCSTPGTPPSLAALSSCRRRSSVSEPERSPLWASWGPQGDHNGDAVRNRRRKSIQAVGLWAS